MGNNELIAIANAREIEQLPYTILKQMFPSVTYKVSGEVWFRKFIGHKDNPLTGKKESYAVGEWRDHENGMTFDNPTQAALWAETHYTEGHWRVYAYVPELHQAGSVAV